MESSSKNLRRKFLSKHFGMTNVLCFKIKDSWQHWMNMFYDGGSHFLGIFVYNSVTLSLLF